jgi:hypothetical protein
MRVFVSFFPFPTTFLFKAFLRQDLARLNRPRRCRPFALISFLCVCVWVGGCGCGCVQYIQERGGGKHYPVLLPTYIHSHTHTHTCHPRKWPQYFAINDTCCCLGVAPTSELVHMCMCVCIYMCVYMSICVCVIGKKRQKKKHTHTHTYHIASIYQSVAITKFDLPTRTEANLPACNPRGLEEPVACVCMCVYVCLCS